MSTGFNSCSVICIYKRMDCFDDKDSEQDEAELAAAQLIASLKKVEKTECELPIVDTAAVWIVSVKKAGIVGSE